MYSRAPRPFVTTSVYQELLMPCILRILRVSDCMPYFTYLCLMYVASYTKVILASQLEIGRNCMAIRGNSQLIAGYLQFVHVHISYFNRYDGQAINVVHMHELAIQSRDFIVSYNYLKSIKCIAIVSYSQQLDGFGKIGTHLFIYLFYYNCKTLKRV